ncbi:MAG: hypothetical protein AB7O49_12005 [Sphingomonadales bacterium]
MEPVTEEYRTRFLRHKLVSVALSYVPPNDEQRPRIRKLNVAGTRISAAYLIEAIEEMRRIHGAA